jgi:hypothetical protein
LAPASAVLKIKMQKVINVSATAARMCLTGFFICLHVAGQIGALPAGTDHLQIVMDPKFHVGDIWEYKTRSGEENSRLIVVRVERSANLGVIVHVAVDHLTWITCDGTSLSESIPHMPFARKAVDLSVTRRLGNTHSMPDFEPGYQSWTKAYSQGHAGIYTIPVKDAVSAAEKTYRKGMGCAGVGNDISTVPTIGPLLQLRRRELVGIQAQPF